VSPLDRIAEERGRAEERLARLRSDHAGFVEASLDSNADDEHDPEGATIAFERSQVATLVRQLTHQVAELDAARERLEAGTYGVCERCGAPIPEGRLEARPAARTCVACAR
jgi:DnaK suppressor protein